MPSSEAKPVSRRLGHARDSELPDTWQAPPKDIASPTSCDRFALSASTFLQRRIFHGHGIPTFPAPKRLQGFTAVFGLFFVPSKHMPSAAFQRAMLHGEAPAVVASLTKRQKGYLICAHTHTYLHSLCIHTHTHADLYIYNIISVCAV